MASDTAASASVHRELVNRVLASMYLKISDGRFCKFLFGPPGAANHEKRHAIEIQYSRSGLLTAALYLRKNGPKHISALPIGQIESRLMDFVCENFWHLSRGMFGKQFDCSFGEFSSEAAKITMTDAMAQSELFNAVDETTLYPLVPISIEADFDGGIFFLTSTTSLLSKLPSEIPTETLDPRQFPPFRGHKGKTHSPSSWLGTRTPTSYAAHKVKSATLGALALLPHPMERYSFTLRTVFGGQCVVGTNILLASGASHTPALAENIVIKLMDHAWLGLLAKKLQSEAKADRKHVRALEYYYRAWAPDSVARFATLFMALDAIFGDAGRATQAVIDAVGPIMGSQYTYERLKELLNLRAAVIHGGAPDVCESDAYHRYYVDYGENPVSDLELIAARCFQTVIFEGLLSERPHTYADLIRARTGRIV